ncbi:methyl-accepting chemotaxis protein [Rhizobium rosettiformans]|uniref:methyl-accepting chemotaxis protein n=2 Tax=Rhizobium rosettiformans TaxID=1368430 RepID=UPI002858B32C|nr:PAS domain-containing methyl-accepting chemotaxis protein [Rhizobium rosettiformans]MDR7030935.1 methyl-accepting chemotaxis protein [Rhizobium rosettiformans]MDR7066919.1 methyl-accepting chemotaxis protein [Rhizobium rosettiformans]
MHLMSTKLERAKLASLETISANIMIADEKLNILYVNGATRRLLEAAEHEMRAELPQFSMAKLVGTNIDIFHKNPQHQRKMLGALKSRHDATIKVGSHVFDLIVTPLKTGEKTVGYVVEWADAKARIENTDFRNQLRAISRAQAVIEFRPDGEIITANDHFLNAMGYRLEELKGKNHRMFLPSGSDGDAEYEAMWFDLRANKPMLGDIVRYGKGGRRVYLNASYNPITDDSGRVVKVVKFANDVSDRVSAVTQIADALQKLASGDLDCKIASTFSGTFEPMRSNFNETVDQLSSALGAVSRSASVIEMGAKEIAQASNDLSRRTEQQAAALEETAAALDEITVNVANASKRADEARSATEEASRSARHSAQVVTQAIGAMDKIEQSSKEISNIISVIDEIAFQTNLLALNAGVEAARAGEAGKGFAVVAQEVRELAQRSAKAAKEINQLIKSSSDEVKTGVKLVADTGIALEGIQNNVASVNEHMTAIAGAAKEQAIGLSEVNSAVNQLDQVTQQNAAMVEESTAASNALLNETEGLRQSLSRFAMTPTDKPARGLPRLIAAAS